MTDSFLYDPITEFQILESVDYEEEIQRPEELRFFTLDEQLLDYYNKVLPTKRHITNFDFQRIEYEVDRMRGLYSRVVTITDTDYKVDLTRKSINVPWITPIYSKFKFQPYSYNDSLIPIIAKENRNKPNYYQTMISALPRPYETTNKTGIPITESTIAVDEDGQNEIRPRGIFYRTKTRINDDGTFSIIKFPIQNTQDDIRIRGYYLSNRGVDIPKPLAEHDFLSIENKAVFTDQPLVDVFPSIEAILHHAVPRTSDPYGEGLKYLKVYDVNLNQISWNSWKEKFPPVEPISVTPEIHSLKFPDSKESEAPSDFFLKSYIQPWTPGLYPRTWMTRQEDGGKLLITYLLSNVGEHGNAQAHILGEKLHPVFPDSTPEDCLATDSFDSFLSSGIYRNGKCIPSAFIQEERAKYRYADKTAWSESVPEIIKEHATLLKNFQVKTFEKAQTYEKYAKPEDSQLRREVRAIFDDVERTPEDKADAIEKIVRESEHKEHKYLDVDGSFIVCEHNLAILRGDLEDRLKFYETWAGIDDGFRVCKFCGEQINSDVFVAQDEFDESGHVIKSAEALAVNVFADTFAGSLKKLTSVFVLENTGEAILYLLLSVLQVLPEEPQLLPILDNIRTITAVLRLNKKIHEKDKNRIEGILGIVGMLTLMQIHIPFLIPRRSFGSRILKFSGFPRDTEDSEQAPGLDTLLSTLRSTFESFPTSFKGPSTAILRAILTKPKDVRKEAIVYLNQARRKFDSQFRFAKDRYVAPEEVDTTNPFTLPLLHQKKLEYDISERFGEEQKGECTVFRTSSVLVSRLPPNIVQKPLELWDRIQMKNAIAVESTDVSVDFIKFTNEEIRRRIHLGFPKLKIPAIEEFLRSDTDGVAFLTILNRIIDILSREGFPLEILTKYTKLSTLIDTRVDHDLLRDIVRGIVYELLHEVNHDKNKTKYQLALHRATQSDLVFGMILLTKEEAEKVDSGIRAKEREAFKLRLRRMNDTEREITKMLLDIGIAPYIITNEDRELFAREFNVQIDDESGVNAEEVDPEDIPEEGPNASRDYGEQGDDRINDQGVILEADYGDYGDNMERRVDGDYETYQSFDFEEGYGV